MNRAEKLMSTVASALNIAEANLDRVDYDRMHEKLSKEANQQLPAQEGKHVEALNDYTNTWYKHMNSTLRGTKNSSRSHNHPEIIKSISNLKEITRKKTMHSFTGHRGVSKNTFGKLKEGDIIHDRGFTSVSTDPSISAQFGRKTGLEMSVHVPKGTRGYYASGHQKSVNTSEKEFILHPGTKFRVHSIKKDSVNGKTRVELHIHSQED